MASIDGDLLPSMASIDYDVLPSMASRDGDVLPSMASRDGDVLPSMASRDGDLFPSMASMNGSLLPSMASVVLCCRCCPPPSPHVPPRLTVGEHFYVSYRSHLRSPELTRITTVPPSIFSSLGSVDGPSARRLPPRFDCSRHCTTSTGCGMASSIPVRTRPIRALTVLPARQWAVGAGAAGAGGVEIGGAISGRARPRRRWGVMVVVSQREVRKRRPVAAGLMWCSVRGRCYISRQIGSTPRSR